MAQRRKSGTFRAEDLVAVSGPPSLTQEQAVRGRKVRLRSGGPVMWIDRVADEDCLCVWEEDGWTCTAWYTAAMLTPASSH